MQCAYMLVIIMYLHSIEYETMICEGVHYSPDRSFVMPLWLWSSILRNHKLTEARIFTPWYIGCMSLYLKLIHLPSLPSLFSLSPIPLLSFLPSLFSQRFQLPSIKSSRAMVLCQRKAMVWVSSLRMTRFSLVSAPSAMHNIQTLAPNSIFRSWERAWQKCTISWLPLEDTPHPNRINHCMYSVRMVTYSN